ALPIDPSILPSFDRHAAARMSHRGAVVVRTPAGWRSPHRGGLMTVKAVIAVVASMFVVSFGMAIVAADHDRPGQIKHSGDDNNDNDNNGDDQRIAVGFGIARDQGITLNVQRKKKDLVGLGSYLVNAVGGCNDCHTAPPYSQDPFAGLGAPKQINIPC